MQNSDKPVAPESGGALGTPTLSGSSLAFLFWLQSLTPTLIPRSWEMQTGIGATRWLGWQNGQRGFMGMPSMIWLDGALMSAPSPLAGVFTEAQYLAAGSKVNP